LGRYIQLRRKGHLQRALAILLLAFTFGDLALVDTLAPQLCDGKMSGLTLAGAADSSTNEPARLAAPGQPCPESPSEPESFEEDCFCCCSHIIHSPFVSVAHLNLGLPPGDLALVSLPSAPPRDTFHPPRLA
jgi:hypothetical protein